jgi:biopolymer transport protein ExbD
VTLDQLRGELLARVSEARLVHQPEVKLAVRADKNAPWGRIVQVMDIAKQANIKIMSAYTKEAGKP